MKTIYFTVFNGYYLSGINFDNHEITYSLNEDYRLWFDEEDAYEVEKLLKDTRVLHFQKRFDLDFPEMLIELRDKGIIDDEYINSCYRCLNL